MTATATTSAREAARDRSTGQFGEQHKGEPTLTLAGGGPKIDTVYSDIDREARLDAMKADLMAAVSALAESGQLAAWLERLSNNSMRRWSFQNRLYATLQAEQRRSELTDDELADLPDGHVVMTARQWAEKYGRNPKKGSKAIWILAPKTVWREEDDPAKPGQKRKRKIVVGFRPQAEFELCQTEGDPYPDDEIVAWHDADIDGEVMPHLTGKVAAAGYEYSEKEIDSKLSVSSTLGYTTADGSKRIVVDSRLSPSQKAAVLAHELGHVQCGHIDEGMAEYRHARGQKETEAEITAYLVSRELGLPAQDCDAFSAGYIASWSKGDPETVKKAFDVATRAYVNIVDGYRSSE